MDAHLDDPPSQMARLLGGYRVTQMLHVAAVLGIADRLADGPASVDKLALATHAHRARASKSNALPQVGR